MKKEFFKGNRKAVSGSLPNHLLVFAANSLLQSSADLHFPFRQDSNFWYLSGINDPDIVLLVDTTNGESTLLLPKQNDYQREWDGEVTTDQYQQQSGVDQFDSLGSLPRRLKSAKARGLSIGYLQPLPRLVQPYGFYTNPARQRLEHKIKRIDPQPVDIRLQLARARAVKQPEELSLIKNAIEATGQTLEGVKARLHEFKTEKEVERAITAGFYTNGADGHSYEPIVANGKNAAIIHYVNNNALLSDSNLLLLDVGAQYGGYASDISRTWALGPTTARQRDLHAMIIDLQQDAFALLKPGVILKQYQKKVEALAEKRFSAAGIRLEAYPHGFSHFLGLDTHDAGDYSAPLQENMVLTVEPGVYLPKEGIGIRIEDNVRVTAHGIENLSSSIPNVL